MPLPLLPLLALGIGLVAMNKDKNPTPGGLPPGSLTDPNQLVDANMPADFKAAILAQLSTNQNPMDLFNLSIQLDSQGYHVAAQSALAMCNFWRQKQGQAPITYPAHVPYPLDAHGNGNGGKTVNPAVPVQGPPGQNLPPINPIPPVGGPPGNPPATDTPLVRAAKLAAKTPTDKTIVKSFQNLYNKAGGMPVLKVDGLYGPKTATAVQAYVPGAPNGLSGLGGGKGAPPAPPTPPVDNPPPGGGDGYANAPPGTVIPGDFGKTVDTDIPDTDIPNPFGAAKAKAKLLPTEKY